ncbi:hypothetical protein SAMN05444920_13755 [Nonomuraea solani]|uniref:Uncharacterized protein n=1 Tax=Nonomuraea solani TaxID=1144553 RepID=A0A1H6F359_9ACTN|nr:hypothetical protein [Nonomuraea solani]SEH03495.1 hypothetical protein SAMN05444920_13755 [Nonomuraea solani]
MRRFRIARAVLLVALVLGISGMHTLGHVNGGHGGGVHVVKAAPVVPAGLQAFVPDRGMPGLDPTDVCLAILVSFIVLLLATAWISVRRRTGAGRGPLSALRQVARPPPKLMSRRLAILSMLRI